MPKRVAATTLHGAGLDWAFYLLYLLKHVLQLRLKAVAKGARSAVPMRLGEEAQ